jgi:type I restriction enzyme S subunit
MRSIDFKNFVTLQRGFDLPSQKRIDGPYPVVAATSITGYHAEYKVEPAGVVTGRSGALGEVLFINQRFWPLNTTLWVKDFKGNIPKYVYYFLKTIDLKRFDAGTGVPTLNRNHLDYLRISIHDSLEQRKIAAILSAYDNLIANNMRRIKILEEIAQLIYREWFVNFRFPDHEKVRMVDSELGKIPEGWGIKSMGAILESYSGGDWGSEELTDKEDSPVVVIRGADLPDLWYGLQSKAPLRYIKRKSLERRVLRAGDVIVENSVNASSRSVGTSLLVTEGLLRRFRNPVIAASFCKFLRPIYPELGAFIHLHLQYLREEHQIESYQHVATNGIANFQAERFVKTNLLVLPKERNNLLRMLQVLNDMTNSVLADESYLLRRTRDFLLPKLISGELNVSELDIKTGEEAG